MKLVHNETDLMGFICRRTYRCSQCGTEVTKEVTNKDKVECPRCRLTSKNLRRKSK